MIQAEVQGIAKEKAKEILDQYSICTISGGYGMGICAVAGMFMTRPILGIWHESELPTELELRKIQSFQEYQIKGYYNETWTAKLMAMKPPQDEGCNTLVFWKGFRDELGVWAYRRISWEYGPSFVNCKKNGQRFRLIDHMFDRVQDLVPERWKKWKKEHPEVWKP